MKWSEAAERRVEEYLQEVERQLAHKSPAVRQEVVAGLRDHIAEAMRRAEERGEEESRVLERILGEMDPPETFAETAADGGEIPAGPPRPAGGRIGAGHWFALGVAFLLLNAYGVWRWSAPPDRSGSAAEPARDAEVDKKTYPTVLRLRRVEQVDVTPERELLLRLTFSDRPDRAQLTRHLRLSGPEQGTVKYRLAGAAGANALLVRTEPVVDGKILYELDVGMPSAAESLPMDRISRGSLDMDMNMRLKEVRTESPAFEPPVLLAEFTALAEPGTLKDYVSVEPEVAFTAESVSRWNEQGVRLQGDFLPGGIYEVTFREGLPAANGASLPKTQRRRIHFPPRRKAVRLDPPGRYLAPGGTLSVPVSAASLDRYAARLSRVYPNNLVHLALRESGSSAYYGGTVDDLTGDVRALTNALAPTEDGGLARGAVDLRLLSGTEPRGVYWLEVTGREASGDRRLLVISDLGLAARVFSGGVLAWVNRLGSAEPADGADVTVYARNNQVLARGQTGADGLVQMDLPGGEEPFLIAAERDGDWTYIDLERTRVEPGEGLGGAPYLAAGQIEAAVFTERGVYRPGETVFVQAIARDDRMRAPEPFPALIRVRRPDGRVFRDLPVELDASGSTRGEVLLPDYLPTGRYGLELAMPGTHTVLGRTTVSLEEFVPPQIRVDVDAPEGRHRAGDVLAFGVRGMQLFGSPARGLKAKAAVTFTPVAFAPENWKGWTFGDNEKPFPPQHRPVGAGTLDGEGAGRFTVDTRKAWRPPAAVKAILHATVMEASGRAVSAYGSAVIDAYPFYIGMRSSWEGAVRAGETQRVDVVQVAPDGSPAAAGKPLVLTLSRVTWNSVLRRNTRGRYEWKSERQVVELRQDTLAAGGEPADWPFAVDAPGDYMIEARDPSSGASTRLAFHAASPDPAWAAWSREKPGRVDLAWDRDRYRPGDTARLQVRAPFSGRALVTLETDRVNETRVLEIESNTAEIEVAVEDGYVPNAWCTVTLIRPAQPEPVWSAHRAIGSIALPVERPDRVLSVSIEAPAAVRPQSALAGAVSVRTADGAPAAGRVTVMAVDEAICLLTAYVTPDPARVFSAQRALGVSGHDLYAELMPVSGEKVDDVSAPGGDEAAALRRRLNPIKAHRFKPVALWRAEIPLDADGRAGFELDLPEFSGELRVMAVAWNEMQTGSASAPVAVRRDLVVQPALPRFLAIGDRAQASIALHNESGSGLTAEIRIRCGGPLQAETAVQTVDIPAGESRQADVPLTAGPGPGRATCVLEVEAGAESYRETIELAVRPAAGLRTTAAFRMLEPGETAEIPAPAGWLPESVHVSGALSALPSAQMGRALDYVIHYPYGCLEQTVSSAFPLLHAGDWVERLLPSGRAAGETSALVARAIARVISMQQEDGGFALWPFQTGTSGEESIYAVHFLAEARAAGFDVPEAPWNTALAWVRGGLDRPIDAGLSDEAWRDEMQMRAYFAHVLARAGQPDAGWNARLRELSDRIGFAARAHAAAALLHAGEPRQAVAMMDGMGLPVPRERIPGRLLDSDIRDASLLLSAWLEIDPSHSAVARLAQALRNRQRDGHWGNTQDNAMALFAFGKLARHLPDAEEPFAGAIRLPGGTVREFTLTNDVAWSAGPGASGPVSIRNDGPGRAYLWVRHEGVSADPEPPGANGVTIERDFLDLEGNPLDADTLTQGDLIVVRLTVNPMGNALNHLVIEDLLPAGWEIENPNLAASRQVPWLTNRSEGDRHREARDDRMLIFTGPVHVETVFHYAVRAVTPGTYARPPVVVSGMYEPEIRGVGAGGEVSVAP